jgi:hypothetical protein
MLRKPNESTSLAPLITGVISVICVISQPDPVRVLWYQLASRASLEGERRGRNERTQWNQNQNGTRSLGVLWPKLALKDAPRFKYNRYNTYNRGDDE